jgi:hypothetical protein
MKISQSGFRVFANRVFLVICGSISVLALFGVVFNLVQFIISKFTDPDYIVTAILSVIYLICFFLIFWSLLWRFPDLYLDENGITFRILFVSDFVGWDEIDKVEDKKFFNRFGLILKKNGKNTFWNHQHYLLVGPIGKPIIHLSICQNQFEFIKERLT